MYVTLKPEIGSNSSFVCPLVEPLVLNGAYEVGLSEFYFPIDYQAEVGSLTYSVPVGFNNYFTGIESENLKNTLSDYIDEFISKAKAIPLTAFEDKKYAQLSAELDHCKMEIVNNIQLKKGLISKSMKSVFDRIFKFEAEFVPLKQVDQLVLFNCQLIKEVVEKYFAFKDHVIKIVLKDRKESIINYDLFVKENVILTNFEFKSFNSNCFTVKKLQINFSSLNFVKTFLVYTDIICENQAFGKNQELLKIVKVTGNNGDYIEKYFDRPHYIQCNKTYINRINVEIKDNNFNEVKFNSNGLIFILHFKKINKK